MPEPYYRSCGTAYGQAAHTGNIPSEIKHPGMDVLAGNRLCRYRLSNPYGVHVLGNDLPGRSCHKYDIVPGCINESGTVPPRLFQPGIIMLAGINTVENDRTQGCLPSCSCDNTCTSPVRGLDVQIEDISEQVAALALQGPTSRALLGLCLFLVRSLWIRPIKRRKRFYWRRASGRLA